MSEISLSEVVSDASVIVRQPIFDRNRCVWGYVLLSSGERESAPSNLHDLISAHVETLASVGAELVKGKKLFLNVDRDDFMSANSLPENLDNCVFGVCDCGCSTSQYCCFADSLHEQGGCIAVDCGMGTEAVEKADIVKISLSGKNPTDIVQLRKEFKDVDCSLLATDITNWEAFEGTRALGFKYFQGSFFSIPEVRQDADMASVSIAKLQLLRELNNPACEVDELAKIISTDVTLSYRILRYINSAAFGLKNHIKSIQQAVSLLGLDELKNWATVVVMSALDPSPKGEELAYMALQRARFLSSLADSLKGCQLGANTMFMLGLFSKLDALLSYPMDKALADIPLDDDIKAGLCGALNEYRDWLQMLEAVETGNWARANVILSSYDACFTQVATNYMKAATWAAKQLPEMKN